MEVVLREKIGVPCPLCDSPLVSKVGSPIIACPLCEHRFTDAQLREYWDFL